MMYKNVYIRCFMTDVRIRAIMVAKDYKYTSADDKFIIIIPPILIIIIIILAGGQRDDSTV